MAGTKETTLSPVTMPSAAEEVETSRRMRHGYGGGVAMHGSVGVVTGRRQWGWGWGWG